MCIIIYKPKGKTVKKATYETCFNNNKDGAGFIVREKTGELKLEKGFFSFQEFWDNFQPHQSKQAIIHFRITTHGETDKENCHPLWVKENKLAFAHNGVLSKVDCSKDETRSDTWHFNFSIIQYLQEKIGEDFIFDPVIQALLSEYIGYSKLAFLSLDGRALIFNKNTGITEDDVWFSNFSFKDWKPEKAKRHKHWEFSNNNQSSNSSFYKYGEPLPSNVLPSQSRHQVIPIRSSPPMSSTLRVNDYINASAIS